jgi:hypothetical protein
VPGRYRSWGEEHRFSPGAIFQDSSRQPVASDELDERLGQLRRRDRIVFDPPNAIGGKEKLLVVESRVGS